MAIPSLNIFPSIVTAAHATNELHRFTNLSGHVRATVDNLIAAQKEHYRQEPGEGFHASAMHGALKAVDNPVSRSAFKLIDAFAGHGKNPLRSHPDFDMADSLSNDLSYSCKNPTQMGLLGGAATLWFGAYATACGVASGIVGSAFGSAADGICYLAKKGQPTDATYSTKAAAIFGAIGASIGLGRIAAFVPIKLATTGIMANTGPSLLRLGAYVPFSLPFASPAVTQIAPLLGLHVARLFVPTLEGAFFGVGYVTGLLSHGVGKTASFAYSTLPSRSRSGNESNSESAAQATVDPLVTAHGALLEEALGVVQEEEISSGPKNEEHWADVRSTYDAVTVPQPEAS